MAVRNIIRIDEDKCNGCGQCILDCAEGALALVDGKAKLVRDSYCDGLGACLSGCPTGALTIEQREADAFDEAAVAAMMGGHAAHAVPAHAVPAMAAASGGCPSQAFAHGGGGGCPGSMSRQLAPAKTPQAPAAGEIPSELTHWPIQLHLINPGAPQFQGADLMIAADCTAFALGGFHGELLAGKALAIACPKLDDSMGYLEKLAMLFAGARPVRVTVARMEVPCCGGLVRMVLEARAMAKSEIPVEEVVIGVSGGVISRNMR